MLSGNGRHRRPRQAPALLVAAGVTGSAIAIPLLAASGASAADGTVWDKVAQCETGGSWSANEGDGEYGGLSLSQEDWETYGGLDYAARADLASRNQQIAVAQKLLAAEDIGAWGTCGLTSGLTKLTGSDGVDTGVADGESGSSESSGLSDLSKGSASGSDDSGDSGEDTSTPSGDSSASPSDSPSSTASSPANDSGKSGTSDSDQSDAHGADGSATTDPGLDDSGDSDNSVQDAGTWSLVDTGSLGSGRHRGTTADEAAAEGASTATTGRHAASTYTVREGDTLASIADSLDLDGGWRALYAENKDLIGSDPSDITPGQTLDTAVH
ncbi:transglycosylase family protein [Streptomyces sp. NBC_00582]|uniref:transglycosylase family protein n=1 Tax=Streptomyces sp. NBC_00582 TaxID=2975783 RepID=UPI001062AAFB|nr:transglycosylase family protein [Streptomyces sp. NBC_00582]WUB64105.1 LysM peptidoglycan-binding domain-containing protein [Streptomyces sp. NBC_00582]